MISFEHKLDILLQFYIDTYRRNFSTADVGDYDANQLQSALEYVSRKERLKLDLSEKDISYPDLMAFLNERLIEDGLIIKNKKGYVSEVDIFLPTLKAWYFFSKGGYVQQLHFKESENNRLITVEKSQMDYNRKMTWLTYI